MKRLSAIQWQGARRALLAAIVGVALTGCGFLDPTDVNNPNTTDDDLAAAQNPTRSLLPGLRALFADAVATTVVVTENASDNYSIHGTGLDDILDRPRSIIPSDMNSKGSATGSYWHLQEMRSFANFVLDDIAPNDATASDDDIQEAQYYLGMAYLMLSENFAGAPLETDGAVQDGAALLTLAVQNLTDAVNTAPSGDFELPARAALARAYRLQGDDGLAAGAASAVLAADANFAFLVEYDPVSIDNAPHDFLVQRELQEMQPLPRLDFLDPKYTSESAGIPVAKAEEMHLILAEIDFANGDFTAGRGHLVDAINVARARPMESFDDDDPRFNADLSERPHSAVIDIAADASSPFISGLVLDRPGAIDVPVISNTSLDPAVVGALDPTTEQTELLHAYWLARQEIFFLEGRRMSDLGIRLPMMDDEVNTNQNVEPGDPGTVAIVPAWIPPDNDMDLFSPASPYDVQGNLVTTQVTIQVDMNAALAANFAVVSPF